MLNNHSILFSNYRAIGSIINIIIDIFVYILSFQRKYQRNFGLEYLAPFACKPGRNIPVAIS